MSWFLDRVINNDSNIGAIKMHSTDYIALGITPVEQSILCIENNIIRRDGIITWKILPQNHHLQNWKRSNPCFNKKKYQYPGKTDFLYATIYWETILICSAFWWHKATLYTIYKQVNISTILSLHAFQ